MMHISRRNGIAQAVALFILVLASPPTHKIAYTGERDADHANWIGKRVVQKERDFVLRIGKAVVDRREMLCTYRVEQVNGQWLWLRSGALAGWTHADQVVPLEQAVVFYTDFIRDHPDDPYGYSMRGTINLQEKSDVDAALKDYSEAIRLDPSLVAVHINRGNAWTVRKEFDKAIADFDAAIRLDSASAFAYGGRGLAEYSLKRFDKAIADLSMATKLYPEYQVAYYIRGQALLQKHDYDEAIADFDAVIQLDPQAAGAFHDRGWAWWKKQQIVKAIADYDEAIRLDPANKSLYAERGYMRCSERNYDQAVADLSEAIRLDPQLTIAFVNRGYTWYAKKDFDKAIADYSEALRLDPKLDGIYLERGDAWREKGEWAKAAADYAAAIRLEPNQADGYDGQAWLLAVCPDAKHRDGRRALEAATKACELSAWKEPKNLDTLAAAYAETGEFASAVKWQAKAFALSVDESDKTAYSNRLKLYRAKKPYRLDLQERSVTARPAVRRPPQ